MWSKNIMWTYQPNQDQTLFPGCGEYMADQFDLDFWSLTNERYPDFKHKNTWEALWVEGLRNSPWVAAQIAAKAPGIVQFNIFACNQKLTKHVKDG
jgi:hypothetical protein